MRCSAPWVAIRQDENGSVVPCSTYFDRFKNVKIGETHKNLQEFFDGKEYYNFRMRMVTNEDIPGCIECKVDAKNGNPSHRDYWNEKYPHVVTPSIRELELCLSNKCNFQCIMCNSHFSQNWYEDDIALNNIGVDKVGQIAPQKHLTSPYDLLDVNLENLTLLRILGGEPLIEDNFLKVFKVLEEQKIIQNVELFINTNNSVFPNKKWQYYLPKFKKISLVLSIDSIGKLGEWNRRGLNIKDFKINSAKWMNYTTNISYNSVIHNFSILGLNDLINWIDLPIHYGMEGENHALDLILKPHYLSILHLPDITKELISNKLDKKLDKVSEFMFSEKNNPEYTNQYIKFYKHFQKWGMPKECQTIYDSVCKTY